MIKGYFGIKKTDINNTMKTDMKNWEIIYIEANNYHEACNKLKQRPLYEDYFLIPRTVLEYREEINANKFFKGVI